MNNDKFDYSYSAPTEKERREIESIKKQYAAPQKTQDGLERLRSLNKRVKRLPMILSVAIGIIGTLIMGLGMTMVLEWDITVWGVIIGIAGIAICAMAYPVYKAVLKANKRKYGGEIVKLSNELLGGE